MANLHDLPELPKSLSALLSLGNDQWKETERLHQMRREIQEDLTKQQRDQDNRKMSSSNRLDAQINRLRREMVTLRQLDASLLCQLMSLNEAILNFKHSVQTERDRLPSGTSEESYPSFEKGLDTILDFGEEESDLMESVFNSSNYSDSLVELLQQNKNGIVNGSHQCPLGESPKHVRWKGRASTQC